MRTIIMATMLLALGSGGTSVAAVRMTDAVARTSLARGKVAGPFELRSRVYPGTVRRYWVYVPSGYDAASPPNLLLFQDGQRAVNPDGSLKLPAVLDTLIEQKAIPQTLGVFVTPGNLSVRYPDTLGMQNPTIGRRNMTRFPMPMPG